MEENLNAKISFSFLSIYEENVTCKRDPEARDRDETETETFPHFSETETRPRRWENRPGVFICVWWQVTLSDRSHMASDTP